MEDLFLLIIKESTGTKHNALRQTAQIAYGKFSFLSKYLKLNMRSFPLPRCPSFIPSFLSFFVLFAN